MINDVNCLNFLGRWGLTFLLIKTSGCLYESESLHEARLAADVDSDCKLLPMRIKLNHCVISEISGCCRDSDCCP